MVKFGFPWPRGMNCDTLPVDECISVDSGASTGLLFFVSYINFDEEFEFL